MLLKVSHKLFCNTKDKMNGNIRSGLTSAWNCAKSYSQLFNRLLKLQYILRRPAGSRGAVDRRLQGRGEAVYRGGRADSDDERAGGRVTAVSCHGGGAEASHLPFSQGKVTTATQCLRYQTATCIASGGKHLKAAKKKYIQSNSKHGQDE